MATTGWKRAMHFLGLVEEYDDDYADLPPNDTNPPWAGNEPPPAAPRPDPSNVRRIGGEDDGPAGPGGEKPSVGPATIAPTGTVNVIGDDDDHGEAGARLAEHVHVTSPAAFNDVEEIGENFRDQVPVLMNLQGASESVAKRILDFASGLTYALDGRIERTGDRIFLLTPANVDVSSDELASLRERGLMS